MLRTRTRPVALLASACGGGDDDDTGAGENAGTTAPPPTADVPDEDAFDPQGVLRVGADLTAIGGVGLDPATAESPADFVHLQLVYGSLLHATPEGGWEPGLAQDVSVTDPQTLEVTLRRGLVFSDGSPLDADAVKASLERNVASENVNSHRQELREISAIEVVSPTELTIRLAVPAAGTFYPLLGGIETLVVAPASIASGDVNANPIGAGPFVLERYESEVVLALRKSDTYHDAENVRLAAVEFVHTTAGSARINALRGDRIDYMQANAEDPDALRGGNVVVDRRPSDNSFVWLPICKTQPPFDDVRVRKALNHAIDRDAINQALLDGNGEPQWGFWTSNSIYYPEALEGIYEYDPDLARELLAEAGVTNLRTGIMIVGQPLADRFGEIVAQQWSEIGVQTEVVRSTNIVEDYFNEVKQPFASIPLTRTGVDKVARNFQSGSIGNVCGYDNAELNELVDTVRAVEAGSDEAVAAWARIQELLVGEEAAAIFGVFTPQVNAYNSARVGGVEFVSDVFGNLVLNVREAYIKR
jgi:peptide/nickel transport system substrate-binding protein